MSVRNTFLHCAEVQHADKGLIDEEQPPLFRSHTAPLPLAEAARASESSLSRGQENDVEALTPIDRGCSQPSICRIVTHDHMDNEGMCLEAPEQPVLSRDVTHDPFEEPSRCRGECLALGVAQLSLVNWLEGCSAPSVASTMQGGLSEASTRVSSPSSARNAPHAKPAKPCAGEARSGAKRSERWPVQSQPAGWTTVIMRNVPNNYTQTCLLDLLDSKGFAGKYDFVYFPMDFRTHAALGYAFVNLVSSADAELFHQHFEGFCHWSLQSSKVCTVAWSQPHQGLAEHVARYRNSPLMHSSVPDGYRPALFQNGMRVPFPPPTKRIKPPRQGMERMLV